MEERKEEGGKKSRDQSHLKKSKGRKKENKMTNHEKEAC